jgi:hypothetical protein
MKVKIALITLVAVILLVIGFYVGLNFGTSRDLNQGTDKKTSIARKLNLESIKNCEFFLQGEGGKKFKFKDGKVEIKDNIDIEIVEVVFGDLNNDGLDDAAAILCWSGGGSGIFYELAIFLNNNGKPEHVASKILGDRSDIQVLTIESGNVVVGGLFQGPDDAMCCPSVQRVIIFKLFKKKKGLGQLVESPSSNKGLIEKIKAQMRLVSQERAAELEKKTLGK